MLADDSRGKPVQILRINDDHSFDISESQLEAILLDDRVKDKPVVVVSVAGAYRQGKSFRLSFFLRYLRNKCRTDWLDDTGVPLGGFEWRPGSKPHTTGILLWEEAFLVTTPQGEEVAVLLMDTQGSFDCKSTVKNCATIFALSVMTSSVQVYNVLRNIQEDQLQHLQLFAEYGKLAQKGARNEPFQRLVFLVRDWEFPYEAPYGASGGRMILRDRLEIIGEEHEELQKLRQQMTKSFTKMDCFLMPRPGEKVEKDESYCGSLEDVSLEFKEKVQELVPWLLAPENLLVKKVNGEKITCRELMNYFRKSHPQHKSRHHIHTTNSDITSKPQNQISHPHHEIGHHIYFTKSNIIPTSQNRTSHTHHKIGFKLPGDFQQNITTRNPSKGFIISSDI
ncbi:hypothetical protein V5799_020622 [Amblyomma americanum]|uniref:GB1/RHD3-type G domain-containing protein n=1 Tax=Amblyomma americanum TaxID=6943 RepID=A0AAQ4ETX3_AMBAM